MSTYLQSLFLHSVKNAAQECILKDMISENPSTLCFRMVSNLSSYTNSAAGNAPIPTVLSHVMKKSVSLKRTADAQTLSI